MRGERVTYGIIKREYKEKWEAAWHNAVFRTESKGDLIKKKKNYAFSLTLDSFETQFWAEAFQKGLTYAQ